jgi:hypothetical protein
MGYAASGRIGVLLTITALAACAGIRAAPPSPIADLDVAMVRLEQEYAPDRIANCLAQSPPQTACRDSIVQALIIAIDLRYADFELGFFDTNRYTGFAATLATLGLGAAASVSSGGTSKVLAAAITGITGAREAFNKDVLAEQTSSSLLTAMRAQRNMVSLRIRDGLQHSAKEYPLGIALADTIAYFRAGTIVGALTGVTEAVGVQSQRAHDELQLQVVGRGLSMTDLALRMRRFLSAAGLSQVEKDRRMNDFIAAARAEGLGNIPAAALLRDTGPQAEERLARIAKRMSLTE